MNFEMAPCTEDDTEFIEEQADNAFNAIAQPEEDAEEEESVYIVTDESGNLLGGCILSVDALRTASFRDGAEATGHEIKEQQPVIAEKR